MLFKNCKLPINLKWTDQYAEQRNDVVVSNWEFVICKIIGGFGSRVILDSS